MKYLVRSAQVSEQDSLQDWINRAKRAHELVDAVDLDKVVKHDASEVAKLDSVNDALEEISTGHDVEHVDGVDEIMPELDEEQIRRAEVLRVLANAGLTDVLGRVLTNNGDQTSAQSPLELIPHHEGLPSFDACLAPTSSTAPGHSGIFVSKKGVFAATINEPASKHHWRVVRSRPYDNAEEMVSAVTGYQDFPTK